MIGCSALLLVNGCKKDEQFVVADGLTFGHKLNGRPFKPVNSAKLAFVDLNEFAKAKFGTQAIPHMEAKEMKLFFETEDPEDYAEFYVNINEKEQWLEIREKDQSHRRQIIKFLTAN